MPIPDTRRRLFDREAARRTVSVTINGDLVAKAKAAGLNLSRIAEHALTEALRACESAKLDRAMQVDLAAVDAFVAERLGGRTPAEHHLEWLAAGCSDGDADGAAA
jgi:post-segregation antitoxin (ccd killing protein)